MSARNDGDRVVRTVIKSALGMLAAVLLPVGAAQAQTSLGESTCTGYNGGGEIGQSFTATATGAITSIEVMANQDQASLTLRVYSGDGYGGTLLHTQAAGYFNNAGVFQTIVVSPAVTVTSGQVYTCLLYTSDAADE